MSVISAQPDKTTNMAGKWKSVVKGVIEEKRLQRDPFIVYDVQRLISLGPEDVVINSYPKSGNEMVSKIVAKLFGHVFGAAREIPVYETILEPLLNSVTEEDEFGEADEVPVYETATNEEVAEMSLTAPKLFLSNIRYEYLQPKMSGKVIYVIRHPQHAALELYNTTFSSRMSFRDFAEMFLGGGENNPYNYKTHLLQFVDNEGDMDMLVLKYEDILEKTGQAVEQIATFLDLELDLKEHERREIVNTIANEGHDLMNWGRVAKTIQSKNFVTFFDNDIKRRFNRELKVNWKLVRSSSNI